MLLRTFKSTSLNMSGTYDPAGLEGKEMGIILKIWEEYSLANQILMRNKLEESCGGWSRSLPTPRSASAS